MIGKTLGHYEILELLGRGGMGDVYVADDAKLGRKVALKVLPPEMASDPERRKRFEREARSIAALNHPNIVTVYSVEEADGVHFITMELVDGETLACRIPENGMELADLVSLAVPIADAVAAAHSKGVVHRDLKPDNIMVSEGGQIKILDFGLAKLRPQPLPGASELPTQTDTRHGKVVGTVFYMSPEQAEGKPVDARSDIFSLGIILYELATGRRPFQGDSAASVISSILRDTPPSVSESRPKTSGDLDRIVRRCLAKDPDRRYQTALDLRNELHELQAEAAPGGRARWLWPAAALAVAAVAIGAANFLADRRADVPESGWQIRPLTSFAGVEWQPSWSPDGSFVAFSSTRNGNFDLFVMPAAGGDPVQITDTPFDEFLPRWSPDGKHIAFLSDRGSGNDVYLIPPLGGTERKLVETGHSWIVETSFDSLHALGSQPWSPDARSLLFARRQPTGEAAIWRVEIATGRETQVTFPERGDNDLDASWSSDGELIAFTRRMAGCGNLWLISPSGGEPRSLLEGNCANQPSWTSDSRRLVFGAERAGPNNIWEIDIDSGRLRQLTSGSGVHRDPAVGHKGGVVYTPFSHALELFVLDLESGQHEQITRHTGEDFLARFAPDGKRIAYQSDRTGNRELWMLDLETGVERQLTDDPGIDVLPTWSPRGDEIAFLSARDGEIRLWVMELESRAVRRLSDKTIPINNPGPDGSPRFAPQWSPDGERIGFLAAESQGLALWSIDPEGGSLAEHPSVSGGFDWYLDHRRVVHTRGGAAGTGVWEIVASNLETGEEAVLYRGPHAELSVAPDGEALLFSGTVSHAALNLHVLALSPPGHDGLPSSLGEAERITDGQGAWHVHTGSWSPDGKKIVYTRDADKGDLHLIENYE